VLTLTPCGLAHATEPAWDGAFESQAPLEMGSRALVEKPVQQDPNRPPFVPYPPGTKGLEGEAEIEFLVRSDGSVDAATIRIVSSTGNAVLDHALVSGAPNWSFLPATSGGRPIAAMHRERMVFAPQRPPDARRTPPQQDPEHPITEPLPPPGSAMLGEHGAVILGFVVRTDGTLDPDSVTVTESSGYPALDRAAIAHAIAAWRFKPATEDGVAVSAPHQLRVVFERGLRPSR